MTDPMTGRGPTVFDWLTEPVDEWRAYATPPDPSDGMFSVLVNHEGVSAGSLTIDLEGAATLLALLVDVLRDAADDGHEVSAAAVEVTSWP